MFGIKTALKKIGAQAQVGISYLPAVAANHFKALPPSDRDIFVTLGDKRPNGDIARYIYSGLNYIANAGYNIYIYQKVDFDFYKWLNFYGRRLYKIPRLKFIKDIPSHTESMIYMFDHEDLDEVLLAKKWKKLVYLSVLKPVSWHMGDRSVNVPFLMYPPLYTFGQDKKLEKHRNTERKIRVYFAGNVDKYYYRNPMLKKYGQMTRRQAIAALRKSRRKFVYRPEKAEFYGLLQAPTYQHVCVLTDFVKFKIKPVEWLGVLCKSDFFLCLSGTDFPMCHNLIESMAVGTIPIMSYPEWMEPQLEHGKNALLYHDAEGLVRQLDEAMNMSEARIAEMRKNVIAYYEEHLTPLNFSARFDSQEGPHTLRLHPYLLGSEPDETQRLGLERLNRRVDRYAGNVQYQEQAQYQESVL